MASSAYRAPSPSRAKSSRRSSVGAHGSENATGPDGRPRCPWGLSAPEYVRYHDEEWGRPVRGDDALFERLCLEAFQSGLSWLTILRKREGFRRAFAGFDFRVVAGFGPDDVERLLADASIVRHRGKIESTINNAARCVELVAEHGSLADYVWAFEPPASDSEQDEDASDGEPLGLARTDLRAVDHTEELRRVEIDAG